MVMGRLSAQCTDARVNIVCKDLFEKYPTLDSLADAPLENIENIDFDLTKEINNMGYHPDYIRRCFKAETGKTPLYYLTNLKL